MSFLNDRTNIRIVNHLEVFLSNLPKGADSYPECRSKVSTIREAIDGDMLQTILPRVSGASKALLENLPPNSTWIPEVLAQEVFSAVADELGDDAFLELVHEKLTKLFSSRLYFALFRMVSHQRLARLAAVGWGRFHQGSEIVVGKTGPKSVELELTYPPHLFSELMNRAHAQGVCVALEVGGTQGVRAELLGYMPAKSYIRLEW